MTRSVSAIEIIVGDLNKLINSDLYLGALNGANITKEVCFDCTLWNNGYIVTEGTITNTIIPPIKITLLSILDDIIAFLIDQLSDITIKDFGFKTQMERLLVILNDFKNKIISIQCNDSCMDVILMSQLLSTLVISILQLIIILEIINGLFSYMGACGCMGSKLFDLLMGKFINTITELQCIMQDWYGIVMTFFQYSATPSKSYVASYIPRQQIVPPPMPGPINHACVPCPPRPQANCQPCQQNNYAPYSLSC